MICAYGADNFQSGRKLQQELTSQGSPHIVKLLGSIELGSQNYLILPAAHGNLIDLWKEMSLNPEAARSFAVGKWMATQVLGRAQSLRDIHRCKLDQRTQSKEPLEAIPRYEIHGDIQPTNILWFRPSDLDTPTHGLGFLQIGGFHFSSFIGSDASEICHANGVTPQYRAPEIDLQDEQISKASDIWAFACVLIEFLTWYLCGHSGLNQFEKSRSRESYRGIMDRNYFDIGFRGTEPVKATISSIVEDVGCAMLSSDESIYPIC